MWDDWCLSLRLVKRHRLPNQAPMRWVRFRIRQVELSYRAHQTKNQPRVDPEDVLVFRRPIPQGLGDGPYRHW